MASATASSNYTASASAAASTNYATTINFNDNKTPKFSEYRSRVCLICFSKQQKKNNTIFNLGYAR